MPILGGYVITIEESLKWASRVAKRPISNVGEGFAVLIRHMEKSGFDVSIVYHPVGVSKFMVVTQYGASIPDARTVDDPATFPQFEEGLTEQITRWALKRAGVVGYEFATAHGRL